MEITQGKVFFKPEAGMYLGTLIDVVEKPQVSTKYGLKDKLLLVWVISNINNTPYLDPEGKPYQVSAYVTATMNDKSTQPLFRNLYKIVYGVLGQAPPLVNSAAQLEQLLLGRQNGIIVTKEANPEKAGEFFVNVVGFTPLAPGQVPPQAPADFVRAKNRPKTQAGPQGQPVQTYSQPQQQPQQPQQQPQSVSFAPQTQNKNF